MRETCTCCRRHPSPSNSSSSHAATSPRPISAAIPQAECQLRHKLLPGVMQAVVQEVVEAVASWVRSRAGRRRLQVLWDSVVVEVVEGVVEEVAEEAPLVVAVVVENKDQFIHSASKAATCTITRTPPASTGWCLLLERSSRHSKAEKLASK